MAKTLRRGRGGPMSLVVLAGGRSRRMGRDKAFLPVPGGLLIERVLEPLAGHFDEIVVSVSSGRKGRILTAGHPRCAPPGRFVVARDEVFGEGPMRGLLTGLRAATHETCFVVACDMPRARIASGRKILRRAAGRDCAIAIGPGGLKEPLFGIYRKSCLPAIEGLLAAGERSLLALYERVRTAYIPLDPGEMPVNLNTPEDFRLFVENL